MFQGARMCVHKYRSATKSFSLSREYRNVTLTQLQGARMFVHKYRSATKFFSLSREYRQGPYTIDKYNFKAISRLFLGHTKNFKASVLK